MAKKRVTAEQREEAARDALLRRVADMAYGACGEVRKCDGELWPCELARLVPALQQAFEQEKGWRFSPWQLEHFGCIQSIANYLFDRDVRS